MGIILDSSVLIASERARLTAAQCLESVAKQVGDQAAALSAVGYAELAHGVYRADSEVRRERRRRFLDDLLSQMAVFPFTRETAEIVARVGAETSMIGLTVPFSDLLIGATAMAARFAVVTANERHFRLIPGLVVLPFRAE